MATLHIEHPISDFGTWRTAFERFESLRTAAGVVAERVCQPIEDDLYVVVQLDFADAAGATAFLETLRTIVWTSTEASPALRGVPRTVILNCAGSHVRA